MTSVWSPSLLGMFVATIISSPCIAAQVNQEPESVDFDRQIAPIFASQCVHCHGPDDQRGGLRLDNLEAAARGGDTGLPILSGTSEANEIFRRVSSTDPTFRMPKGADPLAAAQIETVRRWVDEGAPWPKPKPAHQNDESSSTIVDWVVSQLEPLADWWKDVRRCNQYAVPMLWLFLVGHVLVLVIERLKQNVTSEGDSTMGRVRAKLRGIGWRHYIAFETVFLMVFLLFVFYGGWALESQRVMDLQHQIDQVTKVDRTTRLFGNPPVPFRPELPAGLQHTYYRGNCERSPELFNGGNYRTATFDVSLVSASGALLESGDPIPDEGMMIRFEMERAAGATPLLFTKETMASVFLSDVYYAAESKIRTADSPDPVRLETTENGNRWSADYPIAKWDGASHSLNGLVYIYKGRLTESEVQGTAHYAIRYELLVADGQLQKDSDVWMGCLFVAGTVGDPNSRVVPFREWFDHRPIPEITGPNSQDPALLGLPQTEAPTATSDKPDDQ